MPVGKAGAAVSAGGGDADTGTSDDPDAKSADTEKVSEHTGTETSEVSEAATVASVDRKPPGRRAPVILGVAAALFVGAGAFGAAALQPYLVHRAQVQTKLDIARTAGEAITTLWTYTPDDMDSLGDRAQRYLGGDFAAQYRKYVDAIAPTNKQAQVTNSTEVVGAAVESLSGAEATAIVYTNSTATSPLTKNVPSLRYLSYRLTMQREDAKWLVTRMSTITSLDLTPQI